MAGKTNFTQNFADAYGRAYLLADYDFYHRGFRPLGNVLFVQSIHASAGDTVGKGFSPNAPLATIEYAMSRCSANNNDYIVVMPGHVETVIGAAGLAVDVIGVTIIGLGQGSKRAKINFTTAAAASVDVTAASCRLENLWFYCGIDDQTAQLNITAADVTVAGCRFDHCPTSSFDAEAAIIASDAADGLVIENNEFYGLGNAAVSAPITFGACDGAIIRGNIIQGYHGTAGSIVNGAAATNVTITGNQIVNHTADANNKTIVLHASTVGIISGNFMAVIDSSAPAPVTAAAAFVSGNYFTGAVGVTASVLM